MKWKENPDKEFLSAGALTGITRLPLDISPQKDLPDLPLLRRAGFAAAPADAVGEVVAAADYVTGAAGGCGCVREVIELILRSTGRWRSVLASEK